MEPEDNGPASRGIGSLITREFTRPQEAPDRGPRNYVPTAEELVAQYDLYDLPERGLNYEELRNMLELGAGMHDWPGFTDSAFASFYDTLHGENLRNLIEGGPMLGSLEELGPSEAPPGVRTTDRLPSEEIELMYNELLRRDTGM